MKKPKRIEEMNTMERADTLRRLSQTLHFSAVVARQAGDRACKQLEELADRLLRDGLSVPSACAPIRCSTRYWAVNHPSLSLNGGSAAKGCDGCAPGPQRE